MCHLLYYILTVIECLYDIVHVLQAVSLVLIFMVIQTIIGGLQVQVSKFTIFPLVRKWERGRKKEVVRKQMKYFVVTAIRRATL